jgi:hypothetical protein
MLLNSPALAAATPAVREWLTLLLTKGERAAAPGTPADRPPSVS